MRHPLAAIVASAALAGACSGGGGDSCDSGCEDASLYAGYLFANIAEGLSAIVDSAGGVATTLNVNTSGACDTGSVSYVGTLVLSTDLAEGSPSTGALDLTFSDCTFAFGGTAADAGPLALTDLHERGGVWDFDATSTDAFVSGEIARPCEVDLHGEQSDDFVYVRGRFCGTKVVPPDLGDG